MELNLVVTQEHLTAAKKAGACAEQREKYRVGTPICEIAASDLEWVEGNMPDLAEALSAQASQVLLRGKIALRMLGDGDGDGYGDGVGVGYGVGDGVGVGVGVGDGYGYGVGDGVGVGVGYGVGDGYGYGRCIDVVTSS